MNFDTEYKYVARNANCEASVIYGTENNQDSLTQQSDAEDADINIIMQKYKVTGQIPGVLQQGIYGDFTQITDFRTAQERLREAEEAFGALPAQIRKEFDNDPAKFIDFATDEKNLDKLREMGLAKAVEIVDNPAPAPTPAPEPKETIK